ncbi:acylneuraminate cytidylyltransferase family protein [Bacillus sp. FJAT-44742]|uniref:acylneuraminate cytidylyltransferase family protein n=1 Tax=Bacillus sp. FJAT-44742 TaxID=2014005 RepID=UPI000C2329F8|nr:acylneuraminate cytidylyltransferase family protein [Bacillus sp. FJAT-44742]
MSEVLAVIPARGGSKRLPGKNIKLLHGVPLIEYTIKAANRSSYVDRCIVSTDDQNIATISKKAGAEVPFLRPAKLAMDHSPVMDTCLHALRYLQQTEKYEPDVFLLLQPTSPLRNEKHIDEAIDLLHKQNADSIVSVYKLNSSINPFYKLNSNGTLSPIFPERRMQRSSTDKNVYCLNGAIYASKTAFLKERKSFLGERSYPYVMSDKSSIDIDTSLDFQFASFLLN